MQKHLAVPLPNLPSSEGQKPVRVKDATSVADRILKEESRDAEQEKLIKEYRQVAKKPSSSS